MKNNSIKKQDICEKFAPVLIPTSCTVFFATDFADKYGKQKICSKMPKGRGINYKVRHSPALSCFLDRSQKGHLVENIMPGAKKAALNMPAACKVGGRCESYDMSVLRVS